MAKKKNGVNKSEEVRQLLKANPKTPVKEIVRIAHERGIPVLIDGSQGAVHLDVDVVDLDVDFYCLTGHKLYGPTGIGALYGKKEWLEKLPPFLGGGTDRHRQHRNRKGLCLQFLFDAMGHARRRRGVNDQVPILQVET